MKVVYKKLEERERQLNSMRDERERDLDKRLSIENKAINGRKIFINYFIIFLIKHFWNKLKFEILAFAFDSNSRFLTTRRDFLTSDRERRPLVIGKGLFIEKESHRTLSILVKALL